MEWEGLSNTLQSAVGNVMVGYYTFITEIHDKASVLIEPFK